MPKHEKTDSFRFSGIDFKTGGLDSLTRTILLWLQENATNDSRAVGNKLVTYINPHVYNLSMEDSAVKRCLERSDLVCIDGVGIKLAMLFMQQKNLPRVVAEHLFNHLVAHLAQPVNAVMVGAQHGEVSLAALALGKSYENLMVQETIDGFASLTEYQQFFKKHASVQLVLIGAGTPKSELIALSAMQECCGSVVVHIGAGTIKTWAGTKRRGPAILSAVGLEWLHRMVYEPHTRSRYTLGALTFARNILRQRRACDHNSINGERS